MARVKFGVCEAAQQKAERFLDEGEAIQRMAEDYRRTADAWSTGPERARLYDRAIGLYDLALRSHGDARAVLQRFARQCGWRSLLDDVVKK